MDTDAILKAVREARKVSTRASTEVRVLDTLKRRDYANGEQIGPNLEYYPGLIPEDPVEREAFKKRLMVIAHIGPALGRYTSHILGRDPEWTGSVGEGEPLKPTDERVKALSGWHKGLGRVHAELKRADEYMRWGGTSYLWMYTPDVFRVLSGGELTRGMAYPDALELIRLDALDATRAGSVEVDGVKLAYWRAYSVVTADGRTQNRLEVHTRREIGVYVEEGDAPKLAEDVGENPRPNPLFDPARPLRFPALMYEMRREGGPQITQSMVDVQNATNTTASNILRNNNLGGWRQYYTLNAARPVDDVTGEKTNYRFGPSRVLDIQADYLRDASGQAFLNASGEPVLLPAQVGTFDPVNSQFMRDDADWYERKLLGQVNQLWTLDESKVSGESKRESRAAFDKSLPGEAEPAVSALKWIIETADHFAQWIAESDQPSDLLSVDARLFLDVEPVGLETLKHLTTMQAAGQLSLEALLESTPGVGDVATELARIKAERASNVAFLNEIRALGYPESDWLTALKRAGVPVSPESIQRAQDMADAGLEALSTAESGVTDDAAAV